MELALITYIKTHGLAKAIADFKLNSKEYDGKILLKYNMIESPMDATETQDARGIILEKGTWKIMCLTFRKFFNAEEGHAARIDWDSAHVLEKVDGSLMQLYWDWNKKEWCVATSGMAEGEGEVNNKMGTTFAQLFWETVEKVTGNVSLFKSKLEIGMCYALELTTPYNIVVTPHGTSSVTLLTCRNINTLNEVSYDTLKIAGFKLNVPIVKRFDLNIKDVGALKRTFEGMPFTEEGYVVVDGNFNRIKIKNPAYVAVHHLKSKTAEYNILDVVKSNEIEEFAATFPERKEEIFDLYAKYKVLLTVLGDTWEELKGRLPKNITPAEKKRFAEAVFEITKKNDVTNFTGLMFGLKDGKISAIKEYMMEFDNRKLYKIL
jgi:hypothetical protein